MGEGGMGGAAAAGDRGEVGVARRRGRRPAGTAGFVVLHQLVEILERHFPPVLPGPVHTTEVWYRAGTTRGGRRLPPVSGDGRHRSALPACPPTIPWRPCPGSRWLSSRASRWSTQPCKSLGCGGTSERSTPAPTAAPFARSGSHRHGITAAHGGRRRSDVLPPVSRPRWLRKLPRQRAGSQPMADLPSP